MTKGFLKDIPPQKFLDAVLESASEGMCIISAQGQVAFSNRTFAQLLGAEPADLVGRAVTEFMAPSGLRQFLSRKEKRQAGQLHDRYDIEFVHQKTGVTVHLSVSATPVLDDAGRMLYSLGLFADVSPLKRLQERLEMAQEVAQLGFGELDIQTKSVYFSQEILRIIGWTDPTSMPSWEHYASLVHPDDAGWVMELRRLAFEDGKPYEARFRLLRPDGEIRHVLAHVRVFRDHAGRPLKTYATVLDLTPQFERDTLIAEQREKMGASSRLTALGEMAGGIAHEINSPLTTIKLTAEQIGERLEEPGLDPAQLASLTRRISSNVDRVARIVQELRLFSRDAAQDARTKLRLAQLIEDSLTLCTERMKAAGITVTVAPFEDLEIEANATEFKQVLLSLLQNAQEALKAESRREIRISVETSERDFTLRFEDTGRGIAPELREKIFQPFFTTKDIGKGTGLGLSVSRAIIERHGGTLTLDGATPATTFVLRLPRKAGGHFAVLNAAEALNAHLGWRQKLTQYVLHPDGSLDPAEVGRDDRCQLGQWIRKTQAQHRADPAFAALDSAHRHFHECAGQIVRRVNAGERLAAETILGSHSRYDSLSVQVISALKDLSG